MTLTGWLQLLAPLPQGAMITTLGLAHMGLGNKEALVVAAALETNKTVRSLDLSHNSLEERAALAFGKMLAVRLRGGQGAARF